MSETPVMKDRISVLKYDPSTGQTNIFPEELSQTFHLWELFMVNFQKYWVDIFLLLKYIRIKFRKIWTEIKFYFIYTGIQKEEYMRSDRLFFKKLEEIIDYDGPSFHSIFRCYTAAKLLRLFLADKKGKLKARLVNFQGSPFPDHIWMEIQNKNGKIMYILQAFYYAYTFNGTYGLYRMDPNVVSLYQQIKKEYEILSTGKGFNNIGDWYNRVLVVNKWFENFTGVDISRHKIANDTLKKGLGLYAPKIVEDKWFNISTDISNTEVALNRMRRLVEGIYLNFKAYQIPKEITWVNDQVNPYYIFRCELKPIRQFDVEFIGLRSELGVDKCFFKTENECKSPCKWYWSISECNIFKNWINEGGYEKYMIQNIVVDVNTICYSFVTTLNRIQSDSQRNITKFEYYLKQARRLYDYYHVEYVFDNIPMEVDATEKESSSRLFLGVPIQ